MNSFTRREVNNQVDRLDKLTKKFREDGGTFSTMAVGHIDETTGLFRGGINKRACLLSSLEYKRPGGSSYILKAMDTLKINALDARKLEQGFCQFSCACEDYKCGFWYEVGLALRNRFLKKGIQIIDAMS